MLEQTWVTRQNLVGFQAPSGSLRGANHIVHYMVSHSLVYFTNNKHCQVILNANSACYRHIDTYNYSNGYSIVCFQQKVSC